MPAGDVETYYSDNQWQNRIEGTNFVFGADPTRGAAVWSGRARARSDATTHVVRGVNGKVEQRHSYSTGVGGRDAAGGQAESRSIILAGFAEPRVRDR
jgi:hypothetical protein